MSGLVKDWEHYASKENMSLGFVGDMQPYAIIKAALELEALHKALHPKKRKGDKK